MRGLGKVLKSFDVHAKNEEDVYIRSAAGAAVTVIASLALIILVIYEVANFTHPPHQDVISVDTVPDNLRIKFDIEFPNLPCSKTHFDLVDDSGDALLDKYIISTRIHKADLAPDQSWGRQPTGSYCGPCATEGDGQCCNTCAAVRESFVRAGMGASQADTSEQCVWERRARMPVLPGCRVTGFFDCQKLKGNLHIAAGNSTNEQHADHRHHVHQIDPRDVEAFDMSHRVRELSFGPSFPGMVNPLDGAQFVAPGAAQLVYLIQLVPTVYVYAGGTGVLTNQYSVTEHVRLVNYNNPQAWFLPGVFFKYDINPLRLKLMEQERSWGHFFTRLCAIIGGVYVVLGMAYRTIEAVVSSTFKKK